MTVGDRVWLNEDVNLHNRIVVGTITKISQAGYTYVTWDEPTTYPVSHFSPYTASRELKIVTGDDALHRHDWDCEKDIKDPPCLRCGVIQTNDNENGPCK